MSSTPLVALVYLSWGGSDVTQQIAKIVKYSKFSCQHMGFLKLKMHQYPFSPEALLQTPKPLIGWRGNTPPYTPLDVSISPPSAPRFWPPSSPANFHTTRPCSTKFSTTPTIVDNVSADYPYYDILFCLKQSFGKTDHVQQQ